MWKIYVTVTIFPMLIQLINAQNGLHMTNSRGGDINSNRVPSKPSVVYPDHDYNTKLPNENNTVFEVTNEPRYKYNTNSRNAYGGINVLSQSNALFNSNKSANALALNNSLTTFAAFEANSKVSHTTPEERESFISKIFEILTLITQRQNLVYSPISLQMLLAFIFAISEGKLNEELAQILALPNNRTYIAEIFENVIQATSLKNTPPTTLIMANKLYYDFRYGPINSSVHNLAVNSFSSEIEQIDFLASKKAADTINSWVSTKTRNLIRDIVTPSFLSTDTSALLLNSIYFKGEWLTKFATHDTETQQFFVTKQVQIPVDMMYNDDVFRYGNFSDDLQASVVELPYNSSDLTMMLILPEDIEGLAVVESKLKFFDLERISQRLKRETVTVKLPRFKVEFEIDMIKPLQQMGLTALFNGAGIIKLFQDQQKPFKIDQFKHKSVINVNEAGTEAAAATVSKYISLSIPVNMKYFVADHPFIFVIRDTNTTFFIGHVVHF